MKKLRQIILSLAMVSVALQSYSYTPSPQVQASQREFAADRFGIFIHWGVYSMFGQGEWFLNGGPRADEYAKAAAGFYPIGFNAEEWAEAISGSGAKYVCFTSRHHDGFSMWHTAQSDYNIYDATPFHRDVIGELAQACHNHNLSLHFYYSHLDWTRPDYPLGQTGHTTGRDTSLADWASYRKFMDGQLTELLTNYGKIRAIWFDGWWDHNQDETPFDWQLESQYELIHSLQPGCLVGNNHHQNPFPGEDIQIFERDLPGENNAGFSGGQDISTLPLETCETMNGMWGYKVTDTDYKDTPTLIRLLVKTAGLGANLLLNIGPQPDGRLPQTSLQRLKEMGEWFSVYGQTIYATEGSPWDAQQWGTFTKRDNRLFAHVISPDDSRRIVLPEGVKVKSVKSFVDKTPLKYSKEGKTIVIALPENIDVPDFVVEIETKK